MAAWAFSSSLVLQRSEASAHHPGSYHPLSPSTETPISSRITLQASPASPPLLVSNPLLGREDDGALDGERDQRATEAVLRGLSAMLREAIPSGGRPDEILQGQELQLLYQAHTSCCFLAASEARHCEASPIGSSEEQRMLLDIRPDIIQAGEVEITWQANGIYYMDCHSPLVVIVYPLPC